MVSAAKVCCRCGDGHFTTARDQFADEQGDERKGVKSKFGNTDRIWASVFALSCCMVTCHIEWAPSPPSPPS